MYPIITIFGKSFGTYSLIAITAAIAVGAIFCKRIRKQGLDDNQAIIFLLCVAGGILVGGSLLFGFTNIRLLLRLTEASSLKEILNILITVFGGSVFYGGFYGGLIGGYWYIRKNKLDICVYGDTVAPLIPLFHGFARIGCFFGGCCYGIESHFGFIITDNNYVPDLNSVRRFPVQLLESAINFLLFFFLEYLYRRKYKNSQKTTVVSNPANKLLPLYMLLYAISRFFLEFLRGDSYRGYIGKLSVSQFIAVITLILSASLILIPRKTQKTE